MHRVYNTVVAVTKKLCGLNKQKLVAIATSLERSQPNFTLQKSGEDRRVLSEIILPEPVVKPEAVSAIIVYHSMSLKWRHSTDHIQLPIRLPDQLHAYLMPFRRYSVTKKGVESVDKK